MLTRLKEIAYDNVAKKFEARDTAGRKVTVPLGSTPGVGDRLTIRRGSFGAPAAGVLTQLNGGSGIVDMSAATVVEQVGNSVTFEDADPQALGGLGHTKAPQFHEDGLYVLTSSLWVPAGGLDVGAKLATYPNIQDGVWIPENQSLPAEDAYPCSVVGQGTTRVNHSVAWGDPAFEEDLALWYRVLGHSGSAITAVATLVILRIG